jgi:hypothetical protein
MARLRRIAKTPIGRLAFPGDSVVVCAVEDSDGVGQ